MQYTTMKCVVERVYKDRNSIVVSIIKFAPDVRIEQVGGKEDINFGNKILQAFMGIEESREEPVAVIYIPYNNWVLLSPKYSVGDVFEFDADTGQIEFKKDVSNL